MTDRLGPKATDQGDLQNHLNNKKDKSQVQLELDVEALLNKNEDPKKKNHLLSEWLALGIGWQLTGKPYPFYLQFQLATIQLEPAHQRRSMSQSLGRRQHEVR